MSSPTVTVDIVDESALSRTYNGQLVVVRGQRIAQVTGLNDGTATAAATALPRAIAAVQQKFPLYSGWPGATCVLISHESMGLAQSDDVAKFRLVYDTPTVGPPGSTLTVSDTTSTERDTTQIVRNDNPALGPKTCHQVIVPFVDPNNAANNKPTPGTITYDRVFRHIVFSGMVKGINLAPFRACVNQVNKDPWYGLPPAYWKLEVFHDECVDFYGQTYRVQLEVKADINRDQSRYVVGKNRNNNQLLVVRGNSLLNLQNQAYSPFVTLYPQNKNAGAIRECPYGWTAFTAIFGPQLVT